MVRSIRLLLRPVERFLAQCISISTEPSAFVRECVHLGDTTNLLRAANFFFSTVCTAFLAEVATLYLLGIGNIAEPYYWLFILLTSIPFVLFSFLLVRLVAPLSFKDVLHLSLYPIGAGVFTGAALALMASAVVAALVAVGYLPEISYDRSQWGGSEEQMIHVLTLDLRDCLRGESLVYTVLAAGLQAAYSELKPPVDALSYVRPVITVLYLFIAARFFMAAVEHRKGAVFGLVCLAALVATAANALSAWAYISWKTENSICTEQLAKGQLGLGRRAESILKAFARNAENGQKNNEVWDVSVRAEGRALIFSNRFKRPVDTDVFNRSFSGVQKTMRDIYCADGSWLLRSLKATETFTYYSPEGERLTGFSIAPADCQQW
jgi:hypothetical protein